VTLTAFIGSIVCCPGMQLWRFCSSGLLSQGRLHCFEQACEVSTGGDYVKLRGHIPEPDLKRNLGIKVKNTIALRPQACAVSTGGDYEKLRGHIQAACVEAYHRKAGFVEEKEAGLMQART